MAVEALPLVQAPIRRRHGVESMKQSALRETTVLFGAALAGLALNEELGQARLAAAFAIAAGAVSFERLERICTFDKAKVITIGFGRASTSAFRSGPDVSSASGCRSTPATAGASMVQ